MHLTPALLAPNAPRRITPNPETSSNRRPPTTPAAPLAPDWLPFGRRHTGFHLRASVRRQDMQAASRSRASGTFFKKGLAEYSGACKGTMRQMGGTTIEINVPVWTSRKGLEAFLNLPGVSRGAPAPRPTVSGKHTFINVPRA